MSLDPTINFVRAIIASYKEAVSRVRASFASACWNDLPKRKTLPEIAKVTGLENEQSLHHFLTKSPNSAKQLQKAETIFNSTRTEGKNFLIIDETGDKKKGKKYRLRQPISRKIRKIDNLGCSNSLGINRRYYLPLFLKFTNQGRLQVGRHLSLYQR